MSPETEDSMDGALTGAAARAAALLRDDVPVRAAWRDALLDRIARDERGAARAQGWRIAPPFAIAAGLMLLLLGAFAMRVIDVFWIGPPTTAIALDTAPSTPVVRFLLVAPAAAHVAVVGDFNHWNPVAVPLRRLSDGRTWIVDVPLTPGRYAYAFVVDGKLQADPSAPRAADDDFGVVNSVLMVRGS